MRKLLAGAFGIGVTGLVAACAALGGVGVQQAAYRVQDKRGDVETRSYEAMIVAEVEVTGEREAALYQGFEILYDYITGNNEGRAEVEMTVPVRQEPREIPMTVPVTQRASGDRWRVSFVMPKGSTLASLPVPKDARVTLREVPAHTALVLRFNGSWSEAHVSEKAQALAAFAAKNNLRADGEPVTAYYDHPSMPGLFRRNEVILTLAD